MAQRLSPLLAGRPVRRAAALALLIAVVVVHGCIADHLAERLAELDAGVAMPARIEVAYVRELTPTAPPTVAPAPPPPRPRPRRAKPAAAPASAAPVAEAPAEPAPVEPPAPPETVAQAASEPAPPAPEPAASAPEAAASAPAFAWPASTRVGYVLTGNYRGEIHGKAQVEWVRVDLRYQVHLDVTVGLPFAPLLTRRMSSQGQLTPQGLVPERYDEDSKMAFQDRRRSTIRFEADAVVLPGERRSERWPGVQDQASQFAQLTYLFTTQPALLATGQVIAVPLALPRNVDRWVYDVRELETLYTPFGPVEAFHLVPRRVTRPAGALSAEIWFAPSLAYLPVRIRIRQDTDTFIDLMIERKPQLAAE
ncbi:MAG TPA: DUF3108 domain-containing protein [Albitalea sp.]|uniref:DUF3108 domain-containing protein n=1 Tax=Piscinibacter sp. TaxID=1903157 RepID=UPI002ED25175